MKINLLFFGNIAEITGKKNMEMENITDVNGLKAYLHKQYPDLKNRRYQVAVNQNIANDNTDLQENDEVALLPPFSGG